MLVYYFVPFIVSNRYLLFWVSNGHNSVTVQNRTHELSDHKDLGNHLLQLCPKVVKHPVYPHLSLVWSDATRTRRIVSESETNMAALIFKQNAVCVHIIWRQHLEKRSKYWAQKTNVSDNHHKSNNNRVHCSFRNIDCLWDLSTSVYQLPKILVHSSFYPLPWWPFSSSYF